MTDKTETFEQTAERLQREAKNTINVFAKPVDADKPGGPWITVLEINGIQMTSREFARAGAEGLSERVNQAMAELQVMAVQLNKLHPSPKLTITAPPDRGSNFASVRVEASCAAELGVDQINDPARARVVARVRRARVVALDRVARPRRTARARPHHERRAGWDGEPVTASLYEMIEKRYPSPGWQVLWEVANGTGYKTKRHADAVAIGIWPSHGYAIHGIEIKRTRSDLMREFADPSKADAVGVYCDHWWLVVEDAKITEGVEIPPTWGILAPKNQLLRVVRKAPERKAKAVDRSFFAALVRNVMAGYVPKHQHEALRERQHDEIAKELEQHREMYRDDAEHKLKQLEARIAAFEEASGVKIDHYQGGAIGDAVRRVFELRHELGRDQLQHHITKLEGSADQHAYVAERARAAAASLRELMASPPEQLDLLKGVG